MASLGLPGLAGFWGEFPAILSAYNPAPQLNVTLFRTLMVIAALGTVLAAGYLLWLYQRTAFGTPNPEFSNHGHAHSLSAAANDDHHGDDIHDVTTFEWIAWTPFLVAIVVFGIFPQLMFKVMDPAVTELVKVFQK
jgi:NADH-quinone oxidoreductase subunit M